MNLIGRRRALMTKNNGNLARFSVTNWYGNVNKPIKIDNGYSVTAIVNHGSNVLASFTLTSFKIMQRLWGKTVKVSADLTTLNGTKIFFRSGYRNNNWGWTDFSLKALSTDGRHELIFTLPDTCPSNILSDNPNFMILINVQTNAVSEPNTVTIKNVRLEVVE